MSTNDFNYFDAIYCINLDSRPDRWISVQQEFKKIWINTLVKRFSAVYTPKNGHLWCMLSHRLIVEEAVSKKWKNVLVFEDDILITNSEKFIEQVIHLSKVINYDLAYFWGLFIHPDARLSARSDSFLSMSHIYGAHAVVYTSNIYNIFLQLINRNSLLEKKYTTFDAILWKKIQPYVLSIIPNKIYLWTKEDFSNTENYRKWSIFSFLNQVGFFTCQFKMLHFIHFLFFTLSSRLCCLNIHIKKLLFSDLK